MIRGRRAGLASSALSLRERVGVERAGHDVCHRAGEAGAGAARATWTEATNAAAVRGDAQQQLLVQAE